MVTKLSISTIIFHSRADFKKGINSGSCSHRENDLVQKTSLVARTYYKKDGMLHKLQDKLQLQLNQKLNQCFIYPDNLKSVKEIFNTTFLPARHINHFSAPFKTVYEDYCKNAVQSSPEGHILD